MPADFSGTRRFARDARGTTTIMFGLMITVMLLCTGAAIDVGRWIHAKNVTAAALDAAVIAGGRSLQLNPSDEGAALAAAELYYTENVAQRLQLQSDTVKFTIAEDKRSLTASGSAYINTTLLALAGIEKMAVVGTPDSVFPRAELATGGGGGSNIEISLVLDVTGSMCDDQVGPCIGGAKMAGLKAAAKDLIDIVVSEDQSKASSRVALVPFSTRVRVGPDNGGADYMKLMTNLDPTWTGWYKECVSGSGSGGSEDGGNWVCNQYQASHKVNWPVMPCVTDRFFNSTWSYDSTDDAPGAEHWLNAHDGGRRTLSWDSSDAAITTQRGLTPADPSEQWNFSPWGCADIRQPNEIMPLTANKLDLKNRIDALEAFGSTAGALGTSFGWYMLSPKWGSVWPGLSTPAPYADLTATGPNGAPKLRKVAVIMSDGVYNTFRGWKDQDQQEVSNYAKQVCTNMKAAGIEIYTVAFALDELPAGERTIAEDTLRSCGTDVQHFYSTLTVDHLRQAFRDIALQLSALYLAK